MSSGDPFRLPDSPKVPAPRPKLIPPWLLPTQPIDVHGILRQWGWDRVPESPDDLEALLPPPRLDLSLLGPGPGPVWEEIIRQMIHYPIGRSTLSIVFEGVDNAAQHENFTNRAADGVESHDEISDEDSDEFPHSGVDVGNDMGNQAQLDDEDEEDYAKEIEDGEEIANKEEGDAEEEIEEEEEEFEEEEEEETEDEEKEIADEEEIGDDEEAYGEATVPSPAKESIPVDVKEEELSDPEDIYNATPPPSSRRQTHATTSYTPNKLSHPGHLTPPLSSPHQTEPANATPSSPEEPSGENGNKAEEILRALGYSQGSRVDVDRLMRQQQEYASRFENRSGRRSTTSRRKTNARSRENVRTSKKGKKATSTRRNHNSTSSSFDWSVQTRLSPSLPANENYSQHNSFSSKRPRNPSENSNDEGQRTKGSKGSKPNETPTQSLHSGKMLPTPSDTFQGKMPSSKRPRCPSEDNDEEERSIKKFRASGKSTQSFDLGVTSKKPSTSSKMDKPKKPRSGSPKKARSTSGNADRQTSRTKNGSWTNHEKACLIELVKAQRKEEEERGLPALRDERLFQKMSLLLKQRHSIDRSTNAAKNAWNRGCRAKSGMDERVGKHSGKLVTSAQGKARKQQQQQAKKVTKKGKKKDESGDKDIESDEIELGDYEHDKFGNEEDEDYNEPQYRY
ncbi:hypothetical protein G7Y89_g2759 [Cudoniella acicularis]|uniref:Myb-like domain-containing protein n=1 Tax=Cudoniella acicularis TaxID=354080 RepID=A0A8H4RUI1_9HELO|nr:hypothetical protein G7Y89_g2759 [Cudoniella acicularis]